MSVIQAVPVKRRGHLGIAKVVVATALMISPAYVGGFLVGRYVNRGEMSISIVALICLAMFVIGAFLMVGLLKE